MYRVYHQTTTDGQTRIGRRGTNLRERCGSQEGTRANGRKSEQRRRIEIFAKAYGPADIGLIVDDVAAMPRTIAGFTRQLALRGLQPQAEWVANGGREAQERKAGWTEANRRRQCFHRL